jgi:thiamine-phosphate pyrophosphorylase
MRGYYFITDVRLSRAGNLHDVACALAAGVRAVQYRDKDAPARSLYAEALRLKDMCGQALFLVNDRVDLALAVGADGVHLGQDDLPYEAARALLGPGKIIGLTVHSVAEAVAAQKLGADYLGVSPIFATSTKVDAGAPAGVALLQEIRRRVTIPLVAVGGITLANAGEVIRAGADGLCAISAVITAEDVSGEIAKFQRMFA